ncbi:MAG: 3 family protein [Schlesneria sp.]|nr:3 family protein [Schlesneria sp.]
MADERDPRTYTIIGAAMEVHRQLGCGFLESVYQEAFALELIEQQVPFRREVELLIRYKGRVLETSFRADFICFDSVIVELKAIVALTGIDDAQVLNYLKSTGYEVGMLLNFGTPSLQHKRLVRSSSWKSSRIDPQISQSDAD